MKTKYTTTAISELYIYLIKNINDPKLSPVFLEWLNMWESTNGSIKSNGIKPAVLKKHYSIDVNEEKNIACAIFAIETYYAIFLYVYSQILVLKEIEEVNFDEWLNKNKMMNLTSSKVTEKYFINAPSLDLFEWVLNIHDSSVEDALNDDLFERYSNGNFEVNKDDGDFIKRIYESLYPKEIRHGVGAYFTPEWLAGLIIEKIKIGHSDFLSKSYLEPSCGSGVFFIAFWHELNNAISEDIIDKQQAFNFFSNSLVGIDKNPINVFAAKVNFMRGLLDFSESSVSDNQKIKLPIYFADCIDETHYHRLISPTLDTTHLELDIAGTIFNFPTCFLGNGWSKFISSLFKVIEENKPFVEFIKAIKTEFNDFFIGEAELEQFFLFVTQKKAVSNVVYQYYKDYLRDFIVAHNLNKFDMIIGNPPWINWETMPSSYRLRLEKIWPYLGLYSSTGTNKSFSKEDISTLITYVMCDRYLKDFGELYFVLPQGIFQSSINSKGFRKFYLKNTKTPLNVLKVDDFTSINVFNGASSRTSVLSIKKGQSTQYPVKYTKWASTSATKMIWYEDVKESMTTKDFDALPTKSDDISSYWMICTHGKSKTLTKLEGKAAYRARAGVFTGGANAAYYLNLLESDGNQKLLVHNLTERAKRKFDERTFSIESTYVFPFIRGRDVSMWYIDYNSSRAILLPHTKITKMKPVEQNELKVKQPLTYSYLESAKEFLDLWGGVR